MALTVSHRPYHKGPSRPLALFSKMTFSRSRLPLYLEIWYNLPCHDGSGDIGYDSVPHVSQRLP